MHDRVFVNPRAAPPASRQSRVRICEWRIVPTPEGLHLAGAVAVARQGLTYRISSVVEELAVTSRQARAKSGHLYEIVGPLASASSFVDLLDARLAEAELARAVDVTP